MKSIYLLIIMIGFIFQTQSTDPEYIKEIQEWHAKRAASLKSENGWLNLAGLFRLQEGVNSFGSDAANDIVFPKGEAFLGNFILENGQVRVEIAPKAEVWNKHEKVSQGLIFESKSNEPIVLEHQSLRWFIIQRGEQYLVRLRDLESPNVTNFKGIEIFPIDKNWRVEATLEPAEPGFQLSVVDVIGTSSMQDSPGAFVFEIEGKPYRLYPTNAGNELFFVFGDATNGDTTYGAGRFLYAAQPDEHGKTILDFNKAYNPPCAFTAFATCPLPNEVNMLPIEVNAGEKNYGDH